MQTTETAIPIGSEVVRWRCERLLEAGFPPAVAAEVAAESRYDLHALIDLVGRGCSPELGLRILAPLDGESVA